MLDSQVTEVTAETTSENRNSEERACKYHDADIITPFEASDYANRTIKCALGSSSRALYWKTFEMPYGDFLRFLTEHEEGQKDGNAIVFADLVAGPRLRNAVKSVTAIVLDVDTGTPILRIDTALKRLGCLAIRYTSHSHAKVSTKFKRGEIINFARGEEITTEVMRRYLTEKKEWDNDIVRTVRLVDAAIHESTGIMVGIAHAPMPKNRIVIPLNTPYDMATQGKTQQEAIRNFARLPAALAELLGVPFDKACTDPSHLFYLPRHVGGREFSISLVGGPLLDFNTLPGWQADPIESLASQPGKKSKSVTERGRALGKWWHATAHGFQITDVIQELCPENIRGTAGCGGYNIKCPNDAAHSNAGDPDDTACFAINAAERGNEFCLIKCHHNSCQSLTTLDMLGKILDDEWFPEAEIDNSQWNAVLDDGHDDAPVSVTNAEAKPGEAISDGYGGALAFVSKKGAIPKGVSYDKDTKQIYASFRNALLLIGQEKWDAGYNELTLKYGMRGEVAYPWPEHLGYAFNDAIRREIRLYMLRRWGVTFKLHDVDEAFHTLARRNHFNPVCDYLADVEVQWDGVRRVDRWLETYMGVKVTNENVAYVRASGKIVLVAAVRRAREPGCKFDEMMIFEGLQGEGKSTAIRILGGDWYSAANLGDLTEKNAPMKLRGVWIQENSELAGMRKAEVDELKEFMSYTSDRFKLPYATFEEDYPRRCIFIGTVNPGGGAYLVDLTGNRRFWPVACGKIDLEALARDRDQLWAEAAMMESRGDSIRLDPSLYNAAKAEQDARLADDPWVERLAAFLESLNPRIGTRVLSMTLLDAVEVPTERQGQAATKKLKSAMAHIPGWIYKTSLRADGVKSAGYEYVGNGGC